MKFSAILPLIAIANAIHLKYPSDMTGPHMGEAQDTALTAGQKEAAAVVAEQIRDEEARRNAHSAAMSKWKDQTYKAIEHTW